MSQVESGSNFLLNLELNSIFNSTLLSHLEVEAEHGWHLVLGAEEDCDGDGDGDDVEQLDALVQVDQPQHPATRVAVGHLQVTTAQDIPLTLTPIPSLILLGTRSHAIVKV